MSLNDSASGMVRRRKSISKRYWIRHCLWCTSHAGNNIEEGREYVTGNKDVTDVTAPVTSNIIPVSRLAVPFFPLRFDQTLAPFSSTVKTRGPEFLLFLVFHPDHFFFLFLFILSNPHSQKFLHSEESMVSHDKTREVPAEYDEKAIGAIESRKSLPNPSSLQKVG